MSDDAAAALVTGGPAGGHGDLTRIVFAAEPESRSSRFAGDWEGRPDG